MRSAGTVPGAAAPATTLDPFVPAPTTEPRRHGRWRALRQFRGSILVILAVIVFHQVFPLLVSGKRPSVIAAQPAAAAPAPAQPPRPGTVPQWDAVDVDLFLGSCGQSTPPDVCQCQANSLQAYYTGEEALRLADLMSTKQPLPQLYKDVLVRCGQ